MLREPVLSAILAQVVSELADRLSGKIVRRVLGSFDGDLNSTAAASA